MVKQGTIDKYTSLLEGLSKRQHRINSVTKILAKFKVSRGATKHLKEMGLLTERPDGGYKWSGPKNPAAPLALELVTRINTEVMNAVAAAKGHRNTNPSRKQHVLASTATTVPASILSKLRKEREEHVEKIEKIDKVLTAAEELAA